MKALLAALIFALVPSAWPTPIPTPPPNAPTPPLYSNGPVVRMALSSQPLGFDADGNARWLVVTRFFNAQGAPTRALANTDFNFTSPDGYVQWQTRLRYGQPSAILKAHRNGVLSMSVSGNIPKLPAITVHTDTRTWRGARVVATPLGPHLVQIGWFPQEMKLARVLRIDAAGVGRTLAVIAGPSSTYRDTSVLPGHTYRYILYRSTAAPVKLGPITALGPPPPTAVANAGGKAMWLYFTSDPHDRLYYKNLHPQQIVDAAVKSGLHYVELRTAYGAYWEVTPQAKPTIDAIIDGLAAHGIGTIGWTVPRDTTVEDLQASVRTAYYRTAKGTRFTGLALDLERGEEFLGDAPQGLDALWQYIMYLREAVGPNYLLVSTVEDPYLEHLNQKKYPYVQIARYSDVLQPMAYWRMMRRQPTTPQQVRVLLRASYDKLLYLSKRRLPVSVGGQTDAEGRNGYPPASEITASLEISRQIGAIGECFFAWDGTQAYQWDAIRDYQW